jgi:hypothetical protein
MFSESLKRAALAIGLALASAPAAWAFPGGGVGGVGAAGGIGGFSAPSIGSVTGGNISVVNGLGPTFRMPERFRELKVVGQIGSNRMVVPPNATMVRLRLDGQEIPMQLDTELHSAELQFNPNADYARDLYRSILTKRIEVVGQPELRDQIAAAAAEKKPVQIEGYVFDRDSPYMVVKSVKSE